MIQSMYTAAMGLNSQQRRLDVIGNNVANVSTVGFKTTRMDFKDALYAQMNVPVDSGNNLQQGHGVLPVATVRILDQGAAQETGRLLDVMIDGEGYYTMRSQSGELFYSRNGAFNISSENGTNYLVDGNGNYVLNTQNQRIVIPGSASDFTVAANGTIHGSGGVVIGQLNIVRFTNPQGLSAIGNDGFQPTVASGPALNGGTGELRQGYLEGSNVDIAQEMQLLIRTQRAFSFASRALTQSDNMEGLAVNMRG